MKQTVIGIYDDNNKARQAEKELISQGFDRNTVDLSNNTANADYKEKNDGFFSSLFSDKDEARKHADVAARGTVVTVHTQSMQDAERAAAILDKFGTIDVTDHKHAAPTGRTTDTTATTGAVANEGDMKIPVIEEDLQVGKREVTTGGARVRSRIVERPVEEHLRLREEHIDIDRNPVNRKATEADLNNFKEGTIDATTHAEVPVVNKEARVVEEVNIHKDVSQHKETVRDSVRRTDVDVDKVKADKDYDKR